MAMPADPVSLIPAGTVITVLLSNASLIQRVRKIVYQKGLGLGPFHYEFKQGRNLTI